MSDYRCVEGDDLVRWRADFAKVRTSLRRVPRDGPVATVWWLACVCVRKDCDGLRPHALAGGETPEEAMSRALKVAEEAGFEGIDLGCDGAYQHPFREAR